MKKKSMYRLILILLFLLNIIAIFVFAYIKLDNSIPDNIKIMVGENENFDFKVPLSANFNNDNVGVLSVNNEPLDANKIKLNLSKPFTLQSTQKGEHTITLKLFGFLTFKEIELGIIDITELIPCGNPIGIYVETDGVMVLGTGIINGDDGLNYEPALNKLKSGDYITAINQKTINHKEEIIEEIQKSNGDDLHINVRRNNENMQYIIKPVKTVTGEYKIGVWIRDNTQGIGTLTFVTKDGKFGALGHGITDIDTSLIMEIDHGYIYKADIMTIVKGRQGAPGELIGIINQNEKYKFGDISKNTNQGIYGQINEDTMNIQSIQSLPIGLKQEIITGSATILSSVNNEIKEYQINIDKIDLNSQSPNKGMVISIVDSELISLTGGIVQGMSGSPIIQNGKIIGAVTHVFIQDSTKGYGTFIENMIYNLENK